MDLPCTRRVDPVRQSPRTRMYGYFTHGTDPPPRPCSSGFLSLPNRLRRLPSPVHFRRRLLGHAAFAALVVLHSRPSTDRASLRHFALAYRSADPGATPIGSNLLLPDHTPTFRSLGPAYVVTHKGQCSIIHKEDLCLGKAS